MNSSELWRWPSYLTDYKYLTPLNSVLLDKQGNSEIEFDDSMKMIFDFFTNKVNLKYVVKNNPKSRLRLDRNGYLFYDYRARGYSNAIAFDSETFKRNTYLTKLLEDKIITLVDDNVRIGNFFKDLDVRFKVNEREFVWTYQNEIKSSGSEKTVVESDLLSVYTEGNLKEIKNKLLNYKNK